MDKKAKNMAIEKQFSTFSQNIKQNEFFEIENNSINMIKKQYKYLATFTLYFCSLAYVSN
jgi:hypothetical protein